MHDQREARNEHRRRNKSDLQKQAAKILLICFEKTWKQRGGEFLIHHNDQLRREGNLTAIMDGFTSQSPLSRLQAIAGAVNHKVFNDAVDHQLLRLTEDDDRVMGYKISQLAIAALVRSGKAKYTGDDTTIIRLIASDRWFE